MLEKLEKLEQLATDTDFWIQAVSGVALFGSADDLKVFKLRQPVPELVSVADRFQVKPLIRSMQRDGRYQLLALTLAEAKLYANGVELNPGALTPGELRDAAWRALEPYFEERLNALVDAYGEARGHGRGSDRLEEIAAALAQSRVGTLLVEADRRVPGSVDAAMGGVTYVSDTRGDAEADSGSSDVLDDLAEAALRTGGEVIVLEAARMPSKTGAAAVFRY